MSPTQIEWAQETWDVTAGCTPISEGCVRCWAARVAATRLKHNPVYKGLTRTVQGISRWRGEVRLLEEKVITKPLHWRKPRLIFVNSKSDLYHGQVPLKYLCRIYNVMADARCQNHRFLILTKRPERALALNQQISKDPITFWCRGGYLGKGKWPLPNVALGVSAENQHRVRQRLPVLFQTPAALLFVSLEPLLGPIELGCEVACDVTINGFAHGSPIGQLDWVIVGAESGPGRRPCKIEWVRSIKDQCVAAGVPFFYKQGPDDSGCEFVKMPVLDGRVWDQMPDMLTTEGTDDR